ncbi:DUF6078 family protein [uncultured Bacteroides sp.]|uniref:DUF6078 family protein n=1 Tax=uncultured Bacteroides sp. TaxID=162156 RepID=UPI00261BB670|nr:DUF6078 family protein [uncultured Bacteroides sp.]
MKSSSETPLASCHYPRCFNIQCTKAEKCLHRLVAVHDTSDYPVISIVNPLCIPADSEQCPYFKSTQKVRVAWGISHLLDEVPSKSFQPLKQQLIAHFGRGRYYRFYRKECALSLEDQDYVRKAFQQYGIDKEPVFDFYSEEYKW